jgi:plasmid stabilization system protein ParE
MRVRWALVALQDIARLHWFLSLRDPYAAARMIPAVVAAGEGLAIFPARGRPAGEPGYRELVSGQYIVLYRIDDDSGLVEVVRVFHGREKR